MFAETADVTFERKMNRIFGSINFSSTQHCAYSQQQGDRIIVNKNFFATRLMMCCGPVVFAGDHDHKVVERNENSFTTCVKSYDYGRAKSDGHLRISLSLAREAITQRQIP